MDSNKTCLFLIPYDVYQRPRFGSHPFYRKWLSVNIFSNTPIVSYFYFCFTTCNVSLRKFSFLSFTTNRYPLLFLSYISFFSCAMLSVFNSIQSSVTFLFKIPTCEIIIRNKLICLQLISYHVSLWCIQPFSNQVVHLLLQPNLTCWWLMSLMKRLFRWIQGAVTKGVACLVTAPWNRKSVLLLNLCESFALKYT